MLLSAARSVGYWSAESANAGQSPPSSTTRRTRYQQVPTQQSAALHPSNGMMRDHRRATEQFARFTALRDLRSRE
ncbi:hypothetical protein [Rubripirellula lacrimiformis]|uniref:hypothetical protein n=1 Tax=Rubripirellula lacrimiformis TaxID=1930273 RepID=UPI0011AB1EEE|nr:hypothetical protein [Rubripirellula lacrimiformis]